MPLTTPVVQSCRDCGAGFPYDPDADRCPACVAAALGDEPGRGSITYDDQYGHVCTCTAFVDDLAYAPHTTYQPTVAVVRDVEPTESGSYYYRCSRCGAGGWSGC